MTESPTVGMAALIETLCTEGEVVFPHTAEVIRFLKAANEQYQLVSSFDPFSGWITQLEGEINGEAMNRLLIELLKRVRERSEQIHLEAQRYNSTAQ